MAHRPRSEMIAETRAKLIAAARQAFGTIGYAEASMDDFTAAAGLTIGTMGRMALPLIQEKKWIAVTLAGAVLLSVGILKVPLIWAIAIFVPIGIIIGWRHPL